MYHYCHNPGHVRQNYRKLQNKNQRFQYVHYQESLKYASTSITTITKSDKTNTYLISSSSKWVIDSGVTDHMTGSFDEAELLVEDKSLRVYTSLTQRSQSLLHVLELPPH